VHRITSIFQGKPDGALALRQSVRRFVVSSTCRSFWSHITNLEELIAAAYAGAWSPSHAVTM
jgi:hypothetical protein